MMLVTRTNKAHTVQNELSRMTIGQLRALGKLEHMLTLDAEWHMVNQAATALRDDCHYSCLAWTSNMLMMFGMSTAVEHHLGWEEEDHT